MWIIDMPLAVVALSEFPIEPRRCHVFCIFFAFFLFAQAPGRKACHCQDNRSANDACLTGTLFSNNNILCAVFSHSLSASLLTVPMSSQLASLVPAALSKQAGRVAAVLIAEHSMAIRTILIGFDD
jgi:hypothetical protein